MRPPELIGRIGILNLAYLKHPFFECEVCESKVGLAAWVRIQKRFNSMSVWDVHCEICAARYRLERDELCEFVSVKYLGR